MSQAGCWEGALNRQRTFQSQADEFIAECQVNMRKTYTRTHLIDERGEKMDIDTEIVEVDEANVSQQWFFCYKNKPKAEGIAEINLVKNRFSAGMKIKIDYENGRSVGFIEYIPCGSAWRAVNADNYLVIHCIWVVGRGKKKGYDSRLLNECLEDARKSNKHGVAMVSSSGNWLADKKLLVNNRFEVEGYSPPSFDLLVKKFNYAPLPWFPANWEERLTYYGFGLTIVRSDQFPYIDDYVIRTLKIAESIGFHAQVVELQANKEVQDFSPSAYGVYNIVLNGKLLSYHYEIEKKLRKIMEEHQLKQWRIERYLLTSHGSKN